MKEYYWTITASGFVEAESVEEARSILKEDAINFVMDDEKYLEIDVDPDETNEIEGETDETR
jgi:CMP-N-acetylneuraminic acid synthetase